MKENIDNLLNSLAKTKFRGSFHLNQNMQNYVNTKGLDTIKIHAYEIITKRLAPKNPYNDGKQTPMKGHPVFIAMHATGCCCRKCLNKIHHINIETSLTTNEIDYIVSVIMKWINNELKNN